MELILFWTSGNSETDLICLILSYLLFMFTLIVFREFAKSQGPGTGEAISSQPEFAVADQKYKSKISEMAI